MEHRKFKGIKWGFLEVDLIYPMVILERGNNAIDVHPVLPHASR